MLRIFLAFTVIGIIFILSPERDSASLLPVAHQAAPSSWPPVVVKIEPRAADLAAAAEAIQEGAHHLEVRRIAIPSVTVPMEMPPLRR